MGGAFEMGISELRNFPDVKQSKFITAFQTIVKITGVYGPDLVIGTPADLPGMHTILEVARNPVIPYADKTANRRGDLFARLRDKDEFLITIQQVSDIGRKQVQRNGQAAGDEGSGKRLRTSQVNKDRSALNRLFCLFRFQGPGLENYIQRRSLYRSLTS